MGTSNALLIVRHGASTIREWFSALESEGWRISTVESSDDVARVVRETAPRLIVLEINMPGPALLPTLRALKQNQQTANIPVFIVSSLSERECSQFLDAGAVGFCDRSALSAGVLNATLTRLLRAPAPAAQAASASPGPAMDRGIRPAAGHGQRLKAWPMTEGLTWRV